MLQHMPVKPRAFNCRPKRHTRVKWLAHHLQTQTLLSSCNTPSSTHWDHHDHSARRNCMSCLARGPEKVDACIMVAWDAAKRRDVRPNGLQHSGRAWTKQWPEWLLAVLKTTDFRMAKAHAGIPSRACPDECDESGADARAGTAL